MANVRSFTGNRLRAITNLRKAIVAIQAMDVRAVAWNLDDKSPVKLLFANTQMKAALTSIKNRCDSAKLQISTPQDAMDDEDEE